jgi:hypothetical protein
MSELLTYSTRLNRIFPSNYSDAIDSLIESAKANHLELHKYLRYLFKILPFAETVEDYKKLLPGNISRELLEISPRVSLV